MPDFHAVRLPDHIEVGAAGGPSFKTDIVSASTGAEQRNIAWSQQRHSWSISYGIQENRDSSTIRDFFYARRGRAHGFLFRDWSDYRAIDEALWPGADGRRRVFHLVKTHWSDGDDPYVRFITHPVPDSITVMIDGEPVGNWSIGEKGTIVFAAGHAPAVDADVTWSGTFDIPVRFDVDQFSETLYALAASTINSLTIIELRVDPNTAPVSVDLYDATMSIPENTSTSERLLVGEVYVSDDGLGSTIVSIGGTDAQYFEYDSTNRNLYIKAGTVLDYEAKSSYAFTLNAYDAELIDSVGVSTPYTLQLIDVNEAPAVTFTNLSRALALNFDMTSRHKVADVVVNDPDATYGTNNLTLTGPDAAHFELDGTLSGHDFTCPLYLKAGTDTSVARHYLVDVVSTDTDTLPNGTSPVTKRFDVSIGVIPAVHEYTTPGTYTLELLVYDTLDIEAWTPGNGTHGINDGGTVGPTTPGRTYVRDAGETWRLEPFRRNVNDNPYTPTNSPAGTPVMASLNLGAALDAYNYGEPGGNGAATGETQYTGTGSLINDSVPKPGRSLSTGKGGALLSAAGGAPVGVNATLAPQFVTVNGTAGNDGSAPGAGAGGAALYKRVYQTLNRFVGSAAPSFVGCKVWDSYGAGGGSGMYGKVRFNSGAAASGTGATYKAAAPAAGTVLTIVVGAGGVGGNAQAHGGDGGNGMVRVTIG